MRMSERIVVHDSIHDLASSIADDKSITMKEAMRDIAKEAGYDV